MTAASYSSQLRAAQSNVQPLLCNKKGTASLFYVITLIKIPVNMIPTYIPCIIAFLAGVLLTLFIILIGDHISMKKDLKRASRSGNMRDK
jgi:hypothetical protein